MSQLRHRRPGSYPNALTSRLTRLHLPVTSSILQRVYLPRVAYINKIMPNGGVSETMFTNRTSTGSNPLVMQAAHAPRDLSSTTAQSKPSTNAFASCQPTCLNLVSCRRCKAILQMADRQSHTE